MATPLHGKEWTLCEDFESLLLLLLLPTVEIDSELPLHAPFFSLSLAKNLNFSNIEFLLRDETDGLDEELLEDEFDDVDPTLVRFDGLSHTEPGRPLPIAVGIAEVQERAGDVALVSCVDDPLTATVRA